MSLLFLVFLLLTLNKSMFKFESKTRLVYQSIVFAVNKSSRPEMFKKALLKNFTKLTRNNCYLNKNSTPWQMFCNELKGLRNFQDSYFIEQT